MLNKKYPELLCNQSGYRYLKLDVLFNIGIRYILIYVNVYYSPPEMKGFCKEAEYDCTST